ncbi:Tryptophan synthase alpha chain [Tetrabaena socialis]|uniref:Tryptophan synthase alpha chain n=1 Tax=Tetrabaena socialis TaxID=47790 RepID=A0A2J8AJR3_9CHLO|nr:Tryptophan synthase alpha chain [Tetrabaena socialis]|eukprot:PNH12743.1 Tryptophan synthase alpha chain [Tetrabaena socialis]
MMMQRCLRTARPVARPTGRANRCVPVCQAAAVQTKSVSGTMAELKARGKIAFIPFICAGDPDLETTSLALRKLDEIGADVIELGVPYSDPLADGPVIQGAATRALEKHTTLDRVIEMVRRTAPGMKAPLVMFTYYNPIMRKGLEKFCQTIKDAGASGLLVPDIPLEETVLVRAACEAAGIELVLLATPTTPQPRMRAIAHASQGFVYLVSVTGVTGMKETVESRVEGLVSSLKEVTDKPICVGFGVSRPEHAQQIVAWGADGVICGSALVKALGESGSPAAGLQAMEVLARSLRAAIP